MLSNFKEWFNGLSQSARLSLLAGVIAIAALFAGLTYWTFSSNYQVLFSDLDPQDGSAIINELDRMKMSYQLSDGGKTVMVEQDQVYKTRLKLMSKGINLKGAVGFEIFNEANFGMTDFAQRINYQRALQGELTRTINALEEVQTARVHLVIPESGFLKKGDKEAKASITIATKQGYKLSSEQVVGIQRLVAAAVPEIDVANVTILDNKGVSLTKAASKDADNLSTVEGKLAVKQQTEQYFTQKVVSILDKTFGPGKAIVSVDVTLNYDSLKVTREDVLPLSMKDGEQIGAPSRKKHSSNRKGASKTSNSNQLSTSAESHEGSGSSEQSSDEVEYQYGRKIEQMVSSPGSIKRLSVGVIVPNQIEPSTLNMLSQVIAMSVGINQARGDALTVQPIYSAPPAESEHSTVANPAAREDSTLNTMKDDVGGSEKKSEKPETIFQVLVTLAICLLLVTISIWLILRYRSPRAPRLTAAEREQALKEIQAWLTQPARPAQRDIPV